MQKIWTEEQKNIEGGSGLFFHLRIRAFGGC